MEETAREIVHAQSGDVRLDGMAGASRWRSLESGIPKWRGRLTLNAPGEPKNLPDVRETHRPARKLAPRTAAQQYSRELSALRRFGQTEFPAARVRLRHFRHRASLQPRARELLLGNGIEAERNVFGGEMKKTPGRIPLLPVVKPIAR